MRTSESAVLGAELDADTLRVAAVLDRRLVRYRVLRVESPEAVRQALVDVSTDVEVSVRAATLSWASPGVVVRRTGLHLLTTRDVVPASRAALDRLLPSGGSLPGAGVLRHLDGDTSALSTVGAVTAESAVHLRDALPESSWRLCPAPFVLRHDGLHLALRRSSVELSLVRNGVAELSRQFRAGGLAAAELGEAFGPQLASGSLDLSTERLDTHSSAVARRYVAGVARELHRTVSHWERGGSSCPRSVWVHGPGARLPHVPSFLSSVGFEVSPAPLAASIDVSVLTEGRLAAYGAVAAAVAPLDPRVEFVSADSRSRSLRRSSGGRRVSDPLAGFEGVMARGGQRSFVAPRATRSVGETGTAGLGIAAIAGLVAVVFGLLGWIRTTATLDRATAALRTAERTAMVAEAEADWSSDVVAAAAAVRTLTPPAYSGWDTVIGGLLSVAPGLMSVSTTEVSATDEDTTSVRAQITVAESPTAPISDADIADWAGRLAVLGEVTAAGRLPAPGGAPGRGQVQFVVEIALDTSMVTP